MSVADITRTAEWVALKRHRQALAKTRIAEFLSKHTPIRELLIRIQLLLTRWRWGKAIRATAEDWQAALLTGIDVRRV